MSSHLPRTIHRPRWALDDDPELASSLLRIAQLALRVAEREARQDEVQLPQHERRYDA
jgi:hypothetical protein